MAEHFWQECLKQFNLILLWTMSPNTDSSAQNAEVVCSVQNHTQQAWSWQLNLLSTDLTVSADCD